MKMMRSLLICLSALIPLISCSPIDNNLSDESTYDNPFYCSCWGDASIFETIEEDYFTYKNIGRFVHQETNTPYTVGDVQTCDFYGEYNDAYVIKFFIPGALYYFMVATQIVDGVGLRNGDKNFPVVWKNHYFYSFQQAFDLSILNHEDLVTIADAMENYLYRCD